MLLGKEGRSAAKFVDLFDGCSFSSFLPIDSPLGAAKPLGFCITRATLSLSLLVERIRPNGEKTPSI